ncbi:MULTISPECIES: glycosyltransferase [unclassified Clostridium]|uniref:glycosyltransferase n=1 Tax=unclassified Clostridium TaxID=2614128 RepID=UPI0013FC6FBB|nr:MULTISPECIES: glycosyltransferase [unclassified Clostridium]NFR87435.1 glycosyltransferase [Clostridium botulinum]NFR89397.1 glycosyltransferase [Clostridium botulinum]NFT98964.1 glycosyltransferase [Clostridium botulinum]
MLSLCIIVKNEEKVLSKCLNSVKGIVDEIIVVDTGSKDDTKNIALKFTNKVYDFFWCNDFSKARNFSISKATNDWILILDADEVVIDYDIKSIDYFLKEVNNKIVGRLNIINEFEDEFGIKKYAKRVSRIFNKNYFSYKGCIHEQIVCNDGKNHNNQDLNLTINHIGYSKDILRTTNKVERNIGLLNNALESNIKDPYLYYQLGKSYFMNKDYSEAYSSFKEALLLIDNYHYEYVEDLIESYGYSLIHLNLFKQALDLIKYKKNYNSSPDFLFLMGIIYMNNGDFQKSAEAFLKCTEFKDGKIEGITSYLPLYNIGVIFECLGFESEAINYYDKCEDYEIAVKRKFHLINR